jgi:hypothetical protein
LFVDVVHRLDSNDKSVASPACSPGAACVRSVRTTATAATTARGTACCTSPTIRSRFIVASTAARAA